MQVEEFLDLFIKELETNEYLRDYYRLLESRERYLWRKSYIEQRLQYVYERIDTKNINIWDVGCGYATTAIFLALNGYHVFGNTLEFYFEKINKRLEYWSRFGDLSNLTVQYANLFDIKVNPDSFDVIIAQDTLHHLEPADEALHVLYSALKPGHKLIVTEENGRSWLIRYKNFIKRGTNRISEYYDVHLKKSILFGNENARSIGDWSTLFTIQGFEIPHGGIEFIRIIPPFVYNSANYHLIRQKEQNIYKNLPMIAEFLFLGINFTGIKPKQQIQ
jgi:SAM-dependent methyltransferase